MYEIATFKLLFRESTRDPSLPKWKVIAIAIGCPLEHEDKTLLLKSLLTLVIGLGETKLTLNQKPPLWWPAFRALQWTGKFAMREKTPTVRPSYGPWKLQ